MYGEILYFSKVIVESNITQCINVSVIFNVSWCNAHVTKMFTLIKRNQCFITTAEILRKFSLSPSGRRHDISWGETSGNTGRFKLHWARAIQVDSAAQWEKERPSKNPEKPNGTREKFGSS